MGGPVVAELAYVYTSSGDVDLAWNVTTPLLTGDAPGYFDTAIGASGDTPVVLRSTNRLLAAKYNVFAAPLESPDDGVRSVVVDPQDPIASPFGWHDTNGLPGPEFFDTRGNNVMARADRDGNFVATGWANPGLAPSGGPDLNFDFPVDLTQSPDTYEDFATVNLFYWSNVLHDIHYRYGFDEVAGNFQATNYTGLGKGNDSLLAFSQEEANLRVANNSFFLPMPDGQQPVLAMYEWDTDISDSLTNLNALLTPYTPFRDGDLDASTIIHEYGHGISTRLTGGPDNIMALMALQSLGMGEGWSDYWGLALLQKPTDQKNDAYPLGNWLMGPNPADNTGVRRFAYSYDMTINPLTYADYNAGGTYNVGGVTVTNSEMHNAGEIWASALWDMQWLLQDKYGYDPDLYDGQGGNNLALQLVMDGLKLQPANPTFLDGRDAILMADVILNQGVNQKEIWDAFARRGMGLSAVDDTSGLLLGADSEDVSAAFDVPANPGIVTGRVWSDDNGNGLEDGGEAGLENRTVFVDLNKNGILDPLEPTTLTDAAGNYEFEFYVPGRFKIAEVVEGDFSQTFPSGDGSYDVIVINGQVVENIDFGNRPGNLRSFGIKFNDANGNGRFDVDVNEDEVPETGIEGVWIYVDLDGDGRLDLGEPKAVTDINGRYELSLSTPGEFLVREVMTPGWTQTLPGGKDQAYAVSVKEGAMNVNFDFGNARLDDFGDAPDSYGTTAADGGAVHPILPGLYLGATIDGETDGVPSDDADGDDVNQTINDEDGVEFTQVLVPGQLSTVDVTVSTGTNPRGRLNAWIDFNRDGVFDASDQIVTDERRGEGVHTISFPVPRSADPGLTYARFRYGYTRSQGPTGPDMAGEVEDYVVRILSDQPEAIDDSFTVAQNSTFNPLDVLSNDIPSINAPSQIIAVGQPTNGGRVTVSATGKSLSYTPASGFFGTDQFTYTITDQAGATDTALVTVNVLPSFVNPIAVDDSFDIAEDTFDNALDVLANDLAGQSEPISIFDVLPPQNGTATIDRRDPNDVSDDVILYTPNPGAGATDQFQYIIEDGNGVRDTATVTLHVQPGAMDGDVVQYRLQTTDMEGNEVQVIGVGEPFLLQVLVEDLRTDDGDGQPEVDRLGVFAAYLDVLYDFRLVSVAGDIDFAPEYRNATSGATVIPGLIDEAGAFQTDFEPLLGEEILLLSIPMTANATGFVQFKGDPADLTSEGDPPTPDHDTLLFEPPLPPVGLQQILYVNKTLEIKGSGDRPIAIDNTFTVPANSSNNRLDVLANDVENSDPPLKIVDVGPPSEGGTVVRGQDDLDLRYTPRPGFNGTEQFTYTVQNDAGQKASATVTVQVGRPAKEVNYRLEVTNASGTPVSSVLQGDDFQLRIYVQDIRSNPPDLNRMGVFAAYLDVLYDGGLVSTINAPNNDFGFAVSFGPEYDENGRSASDQLPNVIDELGAFQERFEPLGPDEFLLAVVTFDADSPGTAEFTADPADVTPLHDTLLFEPDEDSIPIDRIALGLTSVDIIGVGEFTFTNPIDPLDVDADGERSPHDVLLVVNAIHKYGVGALPDVIASAAVGENTARQHNYWDASGDQHLTPLDALVIINALNKDVATSTAVAEGESTAPSIASVTTVAARSQAGAASLLATENGSHPVARVLTAASFSQVDREIAQSTNQPAVEVYANHVDRILTDWKADDGEESNVLTELGHLDDGLP
ncbi:MAG: M36 family metallopeptidase [Pirellulaceae bacterium]